jgi:hypothetical protein
MAKDQEPFIRFALCYLDFYQTHQNYVGHYLRHLYYTIKLVDRHEGLSA